MWRAVHRRARPETVRSRRGFPACACRESAAAQGQRQADHTGPRPVRTAHPKAPRKATRSRHRTPAAGPVPCGAYPSGPVPHPRGRPDRAATWAIGAPARARPSQTCRGRPDDPASGTASRDVLFRGPHVVRGGRETGGPRAALSRWNAACPFRATWTARAAAPLRLPVATPSRSVKPPPGHSGNHRRRTPPELPGSPGPRPEVGEASERCPDARAPRRGPRASSALGAGAAGPSGAAGAGRRSDPDPQPAAARRSRSSRVVAAARGSGARVTGRPTTSTSAPAARASSGVAVRR